MGNCCGSPNGGKTSKKNKPNPFAADYSVNQRSEANTKLYVLKDPTGRDIHAQYELGRELGRGEFGITYLATDLISGDKYACKSILKKKLRTAVDVDDVRREVEIMKQLPKHPNIVTLKDTYEDDNAVHIVMELCEGGELFDRIVARGHYTERAAALVTKTIVEVVQMCHSHGVMHRDLKPENFLFANKKENSALKAIDFGLSVTFKPGEKFTEIVGSPYYMAPEVLKRHYGPEIDVWSAGVILYILLCGVPPFWAETEQGVAQAIIRSAVDFKRDPWPKVSDNAKDLVKKMLDPDPERRLTAQGVLEHPWLQNIKKAPNVSLGETVKARLKQFSVMNKLKKKALKVIAEHLSTEEVAGIKEAFDAMDTGKTGKINLDQLRVGLQKLGHHIPDADLQILMDAADVDGNGTLEEVEGEGAQKEESSKKLDVFREQGFKLFQKIYEGAIDAIPSSFGLRKKFLEIVEVTDLAHSEEMRAAIMADMRRDFSNEPVYWSWLAQIKLKDPQCTPDISTDSGRSQVEEVIKVYEEAIQSISSVAMFDMYVKFLSEVISLKGEMGSSGCCIASKDAGDYISHLIKVFEKADTLGCLDEDLACQYVMLYKNMGKFDEAMKLAESFCEGKYSDSRQLWVLRVTEQMKHIKESGTSCKAHLSSIFDLLKRLVKKVAVSDDEGLWVMALELFANDKKYFGKLVDLALVSLAKDGGQDEGFSLSAVLVNFIWQNNGIQQARDFYKRILNLPHPGVAIHKYCIELEISSGDKDSLSNARKLYKCALATDSEDISLWQEYYSMETQLGTSESANAVYWRAKKMLGDASVLAAVVQ